MIRFVLLCLTCAAGYWGYALFDLPTAGVAFHVETSFWSFGIIIVALLLRHGWTSVAVAGIECAAILLNLLCVLQLVGAAENIREYYDQIVSTLTALEALALLWGAPRGDICRMVYECWSLAAHHSAAAHRAAMAWARG